MGDRGCPPLVARRSSVRALCAASKTALLARFGFGDSAGVLVVGQQGEAPLVPENGVERNSSTKPTASSAEPPESLTTSSVGEAQPTRAALLGSYPLPAALRSARARRSRAHLVFEKP